MTLLRLHKFWMLVIFLGIASLVIAQTPMPPVTHEFSPGATSTPNPHYLASEYYPVVVARHLIERGEIITRDNLSVVQMRGDLIQDLLSNPRNSLMTNLDEIVGQSAQCRLTSFQPIYLHMIDNSLADPMTIGCGTIPRQIPLTQFRTIGIPLAIGQTGRLFVEVPIGDEVLMLPVVNETEIVALDDAQVTVRVRDNSTTASIIGLVLENGGVLTLSWYPPNEISYFEAFDS